MAYRGWAEWFEKQCSYLLYLIICLCLFHKFSYFPNRRAIVRKVKVTAFHIFFHLGNLLEYFHRKMGLELFLYCLNLSSQPLWHVILQPWHSFITLQVNTNPVLVGLLDGKDSGEDVLGIRTGKDCCQQSRSPSKVCA